MQTTCIYFYFCYDIFVGERNTKNKKIILDLLEKNHLLTLKEMSKKLPEIDFSIIYRNIKKFVESGLVNEVNISSGEVAYEIKSDSHDHFVCDNCNKVESIFLEKDRLNKNLPNGYKVKLGHNIIHGFCNKCN